MNTLGFETPDDNALLREVQCMSAITLKGGCKLANICSATFCPPCSYLGTVNCMEYTYIGKDCMRPRHANIQAIYLQINKPCLNFLWSYWLAGNQSNRRNMIDLSQISRISSLLLTLQRVCPGIYLCDFATHIVHEIIMICTDKGIKFMPGTDINKKEWIRSMPPCLKRQGQTYQSIRRNGIQVDKSVFTDNGLIQSLTLR